MTINSGLFIPDQPSGGIHYSDYRYTVVPDPTDIDQPAYRFQYEEIIVNHNITAINTGVPRFWEWTITDFSFFPGNENPYPDRPGKSFNGGERNFSYSGYSAGIPQALAEQIASPAQGQYFFSIIRGISWTGTSLPIQINLTNKPSYYSLINGYSLDSREIPQSPTIIPDTTKKITIKYYKQNRRENIPDLKSICWMIYECQLTEGQAYQLPIEDCVLGTLYCSDATILNLIRLLPTSINGYQWADLMPESIPAIFSVWMTLYAVANTNPGTSPVFPEVRLIRKLAANNNIWNNAILESDLNPDADHPMFLVDESRAYNWHIATQINGSYGDLIMDSPRTIEIHTALNAASYLSEAPAIVGTGTIEAPQTPALHKLDYYIKNTSSTKLNDVWKALDAGKYSVNDLDPTKPLIPNLGFLIKNTARVLGLRLDANGDIDRALEKARYLPATLNNPTLGDKNIDGKFNDYSLSCWGLRGRMMPHLPTAYTAGGKATALYDVFHDIPQQLEAILRQFDISLGIQHGSEIRLPGLDGKIHAYPNQLAMQQEMLRRTEAIQQATSKIQNIVLVNSQETREIVSGIGFATTQKYLQLRDGSGSKQFLPYFGHQKNMPSIAQRLTTVDINLAIQNGILMPKKQPEKATVFNPFNLFKPKS